MADMLEQAYDPATTEPVDEPEPKGNTRRCIQTGDLLPKERLIRFAIAPDGTVTPDILQKLPGRGLWLTCDKAVVAQAVGSKKTFARAARRQVKLAANLPETLEQLLLQQVLSRLAIACKAGQLCFGFDTVQRGMQAGQVHAVVVAVDAAENALSKARGWAHEVPVYWFATREVLSKALGRNNLVHLGVKSSIVAQHLGRACQRLSLYCGSDMKLPYLFDDNGNRYTHD